MSFRKRKKLRVLLARRNRFRPWQTAEDRAWLDMRPVGREFGSPDYQA